MKKQYHTRQYFKFEEYNSYRGAWENATYLLMPDEVTEFERYLNDLEWDYNKAFERLTNKVINDDNGNACYRDITLIVEMVKA